MERSLPILQHLYITEGLRLVAPLTSLPALYDFENNKLNQILSYVKGTDGFKPDVKKLRTRLNVLAKEFNAYKHGVAPFVWGNDYFGGITEEEIQRANASNL